MGDLDHILQSVDDLDETVRSAASKQAPAIRDRAEPKKAEAAIRRMERSKRSAYEAYRSGALTRSEFMRRKAEYEAQIQALTELPDAPAPTQEPEGLQIWAKNLICSRRSSNAGRNERQQAGQRRDPQQNGPA